MTTLVKKTRTEPQNDPDSRIAERSLGSFLAALYLAVTCTVLAYLGQTWAQAITAPARTAIILSMEPVFAALFAWIWLNETMGLWGGVGAALILGGIFLAELRMKY